MFFESIQKTLEFIFESIRVILTLIIQIIISTLKWFNNFIRFESIAANKLNLLLERIDEMKLNLDTLAAEVSRVQTVQASAVTLLKGLAGDLTEVSAKLNAALAAAAVPPEAVDTSELDELVAKLKDSTDALALAVADSADLKPTHSIVLNADNPEKPTVEVIMPEVLPEIVKIEVEKIVDVVDAASEEPQMIIHVEAASDAVIAEENVVTDVIKTDEGLADVVVAAPAEVHEEVLADTGVDVVEAVKEAYEAQPDVEAAPVAEPEAPAPDVEGSPV